MFNNTSQEEIERAVACAWDLRGYLRSRVLAERFYNLAHWEREWLDTIAETAA